MMESLHDVIDIEVLTFGELCEAISDRELPAVVEDGFYVVQKRDVNRFIKSDDNNRPAPLLQLLPAASALAVG